MDDALSGVQVRAVAEGGFTIADVHVVFRPLLVNMGVKIGDVKASALMKKLGCDLSVRLLMSSLRVDIVEAEHAATRPRAKARMRRPQIFIQPLLDRPAFQCDSFSVLLDTKELVDFEKNNARDDDDADADDERLAFEGLVAKPTTTKVTFVVDVCSLNQHVNMPLLRLVHQFYSMIENVKDTRLELRGLTAIDAFRGHRKQDSKGSSVDTDFMSTAGGQPEFPTLQSTSSPGARFHLGPIDESQALLTPTDSQTQTQRPTHLSLFPRSSSTELLVGKPLTTSDSEFAATTLDGVDNRSTRAQKADSPLGDAMTSAAPSGDGDRTARCWKTLYALLDLYSIMPEPKTVNKPTGSRLSIIDEEPDAAPRSKRESFRLSRLRVSHTSCYNFSNHSLNAKTCTFIQNNDLDYIERQPLLSGPPQTPGTPTSPRSQKTYFARRPSQPKVPKGADASEAHSSRTCIIY